jgi:hypothetical protein
LSPATNRTVDRHGSKTNKIRISVRPADGGRSSFMLAARDAVIESTSGWPSAGPLRSSTRMAWLTSWWLAESDSYSSSRKA